MHKKMAEVLVGLFFLLGIAAFALLSIKVSGLNQFKESKGYTITADFENIGGLKVRARVTMAGVMIGRVTRIVFDQKNYIAKVYLKIHPSILDIPNDSKASILTAGLLGDNYIGLSPGYSTEYFKEGGHISVADTASAIVLEQLVEKFLSNQASGLNNEN